MKITAFPIIKIGIINLIHLGTLGENKSDGVTTFDLLFVYIRFVAN